MVRGETANLLISGSNPPFDFMEYTIEQRLAMSNDEQIKLFGSIVHKV